MHWSFTVFYFAYIGLLGPSFSKAQVEGFSDKKAVIKGFVEVPGYNLDFQSLSSETLLKFQPHVAGLLGVSVSLLEFFGVSYRFRMPVEEEELQKKGQTNYDDWRLTFTFKAIDLSVNYQSYQGFYLENSEQVDSSWSPGQNFLQYPNMSLNNISFNLTYILSPERFSLAAVRDHSVRQRLSGGSFLTGAALNTTSFKNSEGLYPQSISASFEPEEDLNKVSFASAMGKVGYGYSYIWRSHWYSTFLLELGGGLHQSSLKFPDREKSQWKWAYKVDALMSFGYSGERFLSGLLLSGDSVRFRTEASEIIANIWGVRLFFGARL